MMAYQLAPAVHWVVNRFTVAVTDGNGVVHTLRDPEAAIWDLLSRGYPIAKVVAMTIHIAALEPAAAERLVRSSIAGWADAGLLHRV